MRIGCAAHAYSIFFGLRPPGLSGCSGSIGGALGVEFVRFEILIDPPVSPQVTVTDKEPSKHVGKGRLIRIAMRSACAVHALRIGGQRLARVPIFTYKPKIGSMLHQGELASISEVITPKEWLIHFFAHIFGLPLFFRFHCMGPIDIGGAEGTKKENPF